ncbi:MAG: LacI family DNA-binding transcriptional regulator [Treponema sp.]|nr:LacI family DNA-binding transcriptional regulator [Treponema sp.]
MDGSKKRVTQWDVAREAGVSRSQVSYVISGDTRCIAPETRKKIIDAIDKLGYHANRSAQKLKRGIDDYVANHFGLIISGPDAFSNPVQSKIIASIHSAAYEKNCKISYIRFFEELSDIVLFNSLIHPDEIGGLILLDLSKQVSDDNGAIIMEKIRSRIKNTVCVEWKNPLFPCVFFDRYNSGCLAVDYLFARGYRTIGYAGPADQRLSGIRDEMTKNKLSVDGMQMLPARSIKDGYQIAESLVSQGNLPSAVICGSDEIAAGFLSFLNKKNIAVPESVAVMGMGNSEAAEFTNPPLTTMDLRTSETGRAVIDMLTGGPYEADSVLPAQIIRRSSC